LPPDGPGAPGHLPSPPPGTVWPPTPGASGKHWVLVYISGYGARYTVVDLGPPTVWPPPGTPGQGLPSPPVVEPRR
jgi:hypothetical protein